MLREKRSREKGPKQPATRQRLVCSGDEMVSERELKTSCYNKNIVVPTKGLDELDLMSPDRMMSSDVVRFLKEHGGNKLMILLFAEVHETMSTFKWSKGTLAETFLSFPISNVQVVKLSLLGLSFENMAMALEDIVEHDDIDDEDSSCIQTGECTLLSVAVLVRQGKVADLAPGLGTIHSQLAFDLASSLRALQEVVNDPCSRGHMVISADAFVALLTAEQLKFPRRSSFA
jgi:hypothetical protein